jgi:RNA polymerase primary sigma factor
MIQTNNGLATTIEPDMNALLQNSSASENGLDLLISDDDIDTNDDDLESSTVEADSKSGKATKSRRRTQTKKKHYTEDSIRLYLQEIGRIRLLRADEEIELARKIADLLELERIRERWIEHNHREPSTQEWADTVDYAVNGVSSPPLSWQTGQRQNGAV